jgi:hypothetical protein
MDEKRGGIGSSIGLDATKTCDVEAVMRTECTDDFTKVPAFAQLERQIRAAPRKQHPEWIPAQRNLSDM